MNFVANGREKGLRRFTLSATQTGAYRYGEYRPTGRIRPDYGVLFRGIEAMLREEMKIVFVTSSLAAVKELDRYLKRSGKLWFVRYLGLEHHEAKPSLGQPAYSRGAYEIMECWGL